MQDEEIGNWFKLVQPGQEFVHLNPFIMPLISKLIDERKDKLYIYGYAPLSGIESKALKDFGITEEEWKNRVSENP